MKKALFMETTKVSPLVTAQQIQTLLVAAGARQVLTEYNEKREITGIHFILSVDNQQLPFKMPVRTEKLFEYFRQKASGRSMRSREEIQEKAKRVAWRQLLRWIEAQLAFIDTGMARTEEVFMPYIEVAPGVTVFQRALEQRWAGLLPASTEIREGPGGDR